MVLRPLSDRFLERLLAMVGSVNITIIIIIIIIITITIYISITTIVITITITITTIVITNIKPGTPKSGHIMFYLLSPGLA